MRKIVAFVLFTLSVYAQGGVVEQLAERMIPSQAKNFLFEVVPGSSDDFFEISNGTKGKIVIRGNCPVSVASGLNWYLKYYCYVSFSDCGSQAVMPTKLPAVKQSVRISTPLTIGLNYNYCTFSYSMPYWTWEDWQVEIDRMALAGLNTPLVMVGVESVWRETLLEMGYSKQEILEFLPGAGYMGWFLMGNLQGMGGALSDAWFDRQQKLQRQIVARLHEYGMEPVYQGFFGMVPTNFAEKFPEADIVAQGEWMTFARPSVLSATDPLFERMAAIWYEKYEQLYGKAKYYGGDLFHEGGKSGNMDIAACGAAVADAMQSAVENSTWILQSWGGNPRSELIQGLAGKNVLVVDLCAEYWDRWNESKAFGGTPWLWGHITNWGGNIGLHGRLDAIANEPIRARHDTTAGKWLRGVASVPEGTGTNPVTFALAAEMRWRDKAPNMTEWIKQYAAARYGASDPVIESAWDKIYHTAYGTYKGHRRPSESFFCVRPSLKARSASAWGTGNIFYDELDFQAAVRQFASVYEKFKGCDAYMYDLVDFSRQVLSNRGRTLYGKIVTAYKAGARDSLKVYCDRFLELVLLQDQLLATRPEFCLSGWIAKARAAGSTQAESDLFEYNARALLTTWTPGPSALVDYAHREWSGLLRDYYYVRWRMFFDFLEGSVGVPGAKAPDFFEFENSFAHSTTSYSCTQRTGKPKPRPFARLGLTLSAPK